jgi:predicted nucleic acid-binding protein
MIIADANALVKLALQEPGSAEVRKIVRSILSNDEEEVASVDIALAEALNALWKHNSLIKDLDNKKYSLAFTEILELWPNISEIPTKTIAEEASGIAKSSSLTFYDSLYVAASIKNKAPLLTFDKEIIKSAGKLRIKLLKP